MPAAAGMPSHRAAEIVVTGDHAPDIDPLDLLAVFRNSDGKPAVEPGGFDLDIRKLGDPIMIELDDELCGPGHIGRFLPSRLVNREACRTQIEIGDRLRARRLKPGICHINADRAGQPSVKVEAEAPPRLDVERHPDPINRARPAPHPEWHGGIKLYRDAVDPRCSLRMRPCPRELERDGPIGQVAVHRDLGDRHARHRRLRAVLDLIQLEGRQQREPEMQYRVGMAADPRRVEIGGTRVIKRLRIDELESFLKRSVDRQIDRQPFERRTDFADVQRAAGRLEAFDDTAARQKHEMPVGELRDAVHLARRRQPVNVGDGQAAVAKRALRIEEIGGVPGGIDVETELRRGFVDDSVTHVCQHPPPRAGAERVRPQGGEPVGRHPLEIRVQLALDVVSRARVAGGGDQFGRNAADAAVEDEHGVAAEIEGQAFELHLGAFRRVGRVQLSLFDIDNALRQQLALHLALAEPQIEPRALRPGLVKLDPGVQRARNGQPKMLQLQQFGDQGRDRVRLDAVDRQLEVEHMPIGEIAILRVQLGFIGTGRAGQREIAADALAAALDRHVDAVGPPGLAALLVIDDDAGAADSQPLQVAQGLVAVPAACQLLQHLGPEIGSGIVRAGKPRGDGAAALARQMHDRALDDQLRRH